jgi:hypothetical protein
MAGLAKESLPQDPPQVIRHLLGAIMEQQLGSGFDT